MEGIANPLGLVIGVGVGVGVGVGLQQAYPVSISVSLIVAASARVVSKGVNCIFMTLNKQLTRRLSNMPKTMNE